MPRFTKRAATAGEISPLLDIRADLSKFANAYSLLQDFYVMSEGALDSRAGSRYIAPLVDNQDIGRCIPFQHSVDDTYSLIFTNLKLHFVRNGGMVLESNKTILSATQANPCVFEVAAHGYSNGDLVYVTIPDGMTELHNGFFTVAAATTDTFELSGEVSSLYDGFTNGTVARVYSIASPYAEADLALLKYAQSADVMTLTHPSYDPRELTRSAHTNWTFTTISYAPTVSAPTGLTATNGGGVGGSYDRDYEYVITAVDEDGRESLPSSSVGETTRTLTDAHYVQLNWTLVSGAERYRIYKAHSEVSDVYGFIGESKTDFFRDYNLAPDLANTPLEDRQPFNGADNKPGCMDYYQQRAVFGRTNNKKETVFTTQTGDFHSLRKSTPTNDDDAITLTIAGRVVNEIRHLLALDRLLVLTNGAEYVITENDNDVFVPGSGVKLQSSYGTSNVRPAIVEDSAVIVQEAGPRIRDLSYSFEVDKYQGTDLSVLARHLLDGYDVLDMQYAKEPYHALYVLRSDGLLLTLVHHKEHDVVAWSRFNFGGTVKSISVVREGLFDVLYFIIDRNGTRFIERLTEKDWDVVEDAFCVDSGLTYDGTATKTISGLRHLEGETLVALGDGNVYENLLVTNGRVTFPENVSKAHIGYGFVPTFGTLPLDTAESANKGRAKEVSELTLSFHQSRGGRVGRELTNMFPIVARRVSDDYDAIPLRNYTTVEALPDGMDDEGRVYFEQPDPLPVTILAIQPDVAIT